MIEVTFEAVDIREMADDELDDVVGGPMACQ
ncbi:hypothetical protein GA0070610_3339 [Micromonospora echinofusca]|uniref:Uncharacterized protein n=1 Tax=Micromonospora echinofusca TaxID=47858 RepID=A0A1C5GAY7_MICEH|nr:hypothetical protein GA0070610_3339 [Micromonospora echinofusca]